MTAAVVAPPGLEELSTDATAASEAGESCTTQTSHVVDVVPDPGEVYLSEMLATMDQQLRCLRETQQRLVNVVELACRRALKDRFGRLRLVGSVALCAETPGSDVDVVCFTQEPDGEPPANDYLVASMRKVHLRKVLEELVAITAGQCMMDGYTGYAMEFIEDARVPILRVSWGLPDQCLAIDVLVDQRRPLDHVRWFQAMQACPHPKAPIPPVTPSVTVSLRCVKWWLRQRQIPRTKEGGLPTITWLLLALHTCSQPETHKEVSDKQPMAALASSLQAFFNRYCSPGSFHGVLRFGGEAGDAEKLSSEFRPSPTSKESPWADLVVVDPTQTGEDVNLAPPLSPATQLLIVHELQRAAGHLQAPVSEAAPITPRKGSKLSIETKAKGEDGAEDIMSLVHNDPEKKETVKQILLRSDAVDDQSVQADACKSSGRVEELFTDLSPGKNTLPAIATESIAALLLQGDPSKGVGSLEVAIIDRIVPRQGWSAPFLHRYDTTSELHARLCDVNESTGSCQPRREGVVMLCPCHFVCMLELQRNGTDAARYKLSEEDLDRYRSMTHILSKLRTHQRALGDLNSPPQQRGERKAPSEGRSSRRRARRSNKRG